MMAISCYIITELSWIGAQMFLIQIVVLFHHSLPFASHLADALVFTEPSGVAGPSGGLAIENHIFL